MECCSGQLLTERPAAALPAQPAFSIFSSLFFFLSIFSREFSNAKKKIKFRRKRVAEFSFYFENSVQGLSQEASLNSS